MYENFLKEIAKVEIWLISPLIFSSEWIYNTSIFKDLLDAQNITHKLKFFQYLSKKEIQLIEIEEEVNRAQLEKKYEASLLGEIYNRLQQIYFLRQVYDIEKSKFFNKKNQIVKNIPYDFYNKIFFWVSHELLDKKYYIENCSPDNFVFTKKELLALIAFSKKLCPETRFHFGDFPNFSHEKGILNVTDKKEYHLQNIITLFFHEMTHFFRGFNGERNLWFRYKFSGYTSLEEGIAIYNEYTYGNKLTSYGKFNPYYNICYQILREDITEEEKQEKIHTVLQCKWFNKEKSLKYYHRFHKYSSFWSKQFFLKDLIYLQWYKNVKRLIVEDSKNYEKIISGHIWVYEVRNDIIARTNNYDCKMYFNKMTKEIKKYLDNK